jgi:predicted metalloprotease
MRRLALTIVAATFLVLTGCVRTVDGTPVADSSRALNCSRTSNEQIVACLSDSLSKFWTGRLGRPVQLTAVADPSPAQVPTACRAALRLNTAFSCPNDDKVYLTAPFLQHMRTTGAPSQVWVRIATTLGHEMGHILQFTVHEHVATQRHSTWAQSRFIEQQADCLAGVWAASVGIDDASFLRANAVVLAIVDSRWERRSHGTKPERLAAVRRGQRARTAAACGLRLRG